MIINMTGEDIKILGRNGERTYNQTFKSQGRAQVNVMELVTDRVNGIPILDVEYSEVKGLPEEKKGTLYIVTEDVMAALPDRKDLLVPAYTARDMESEIIGYHAFSRSTRK